MIGICSLPGAGRLYPDINSDELHHDMKHKLNENEMNKRSIKFTPKTDPRTPESILTLMEENVRKSNINNDFDPEYKENILNDDQRAESPNFEDISPSDNNKNNIKNREERENAFKEYVASQEKILDAASNILAVANEVESAKLNQKIFNDPARGPFLKEININSIKPYDRTLGTPADPEILKKREAIKEMTKHAWDGYEKYAWTFNELRPISKKGHSQSIFGSAKTGATIIDAMDTLYLMGFEEEFDRARTWLRDEFKFNSATDVSVFETNIRFIGGLESLFYLTGDRMYIEKARDIASALLPAFDTPTKLPMALFNPSTGKKKNYQWANAGCSVLSEVGTLHMEFATLTHLTSDDRFLEKVIDVRDFLDKMERPDNRIWYNYINPTSGAFGSSKAASVGALGDSFYEYLLKTYILTNKVDRKALEMYKDSLVGIEKNLLKQGPEKYWYLGEWKRTRLEPKMGHLTCFAGGMFSLGSKYMGDDEKENQKWMEMGENIGETCHQSYVRAPSGIGPESFSFREGSENIKGATKNDRYYLLLLGGLLIKNFLIFFYEM